MWRWSALVYPGTTRWSPSVTLKAIRNVMARSTTPPTWRARAAWDRKDDTRSATRWPARAKTRSGTEAPRAKTTVSTTDAKPTWWLALTTEMAVSTGPAQG